MAYEKVLKLSRSFLTCSALIKLYLPDYGAAKQTQNGEWKAAMIYFSGTTNTKYRFYGDSVLSIAQKYEDDIEALEKGGLTIR